MLKRVREKLGDEELAPIAANEGGSKRKPRR
jgi:hypothetical protein